MIRPVLYVDLPGIIYAIDSRARSRQRAFSNFVCWLEPLEYALPPPPLLSNVLPFRPVARTWICEDHWRLLGLAQARRRPSAQAWDLTYLAAMPAPNGQAPLVSPDDVLRELSIYFAGPELSEVIAACAAGADASADAARLADQIESGVERRSGDLAVTHDMVWQHLRASGATARPRTGQEWVAALDLADRHYVPVDPWFRIMLESAYLPMHRQTN